MLICWAKAERPRRVRRSKENCSEGEAGTFGRHQPNELYVKAINLISAY